MYGLPKIHKANVLLWTIVASRGSLTLNASRVLADMFGPLVGKSERHIQNSGDFVDKVKNLEMPPGQKLLAYDVSALFTSIPLPYAIKAVRIELDEDPKLQDCTPLSRERILGLLRFCLNTTYFTYSGMIYKQKHGAAMGSPVSPIIANLYVEGFEEILLFVQPPTPRFSVVQVRGRYIYRDPRIPRRWVHYPPQQPGLNTMFTTSTEPEQDSTLHFLDACVNINEDGSTHVIVYGKLTHTAQYLNFSLQHKMSVLRTYTHEASRSHGHPPWLSNEGDGPHPRLPEDQWVQTMDVQGLETQSTTEHYINQTYN